ncbi:Centrosomal protein of 63 kDa [Pteropus alecto]|uniref:Centrosomal protein of 63 kDa n=1 Tax=Pteropus alecto TaxID=9402 RepID=L5L0C4_PTEAL|nr:Centrosomal protein of 63 kDa [Pteropus alecto]
MDSVPHTGDPDGRELPFATVLAPCFYSCRADSTIFFAFSTEVLARAIHSYHQFQNESPLHCPMPMSPLGSIATRFLEEEEMRSHHILERLDAHIEELKRESEKTVKQFTALK